MKIQAQTKIYIAWTNTDLTEGKGGQYPLAHCKVKTTAQRLGHKRYVQGSDCPITEEDAYQIDGRWYGPITILYPTNADTKNDEAARKRNEVLAKAAALGLSADDIATLRSTS